MSEETGLVDGGFLGAEEVEPFKVALVWKVVTESDPSKSVPTAMVRGVGRGRGGGDEGERRRGADIRGTPATPGSHLARPGVAQHGGAQQVLLHLIRDQCRHRQGEGILVLAQGVVTVRLQH